MGTSPYKSDKKKKQIKAFKHEKVQDIKAAKKKLASNVSSSSWWGNVLKLMLIIVFYFISSIALTFYQKDLIQRLPYPLSIVIVHLVLKFCVAGICRYIWAKCTNENRVSFLFHTIYVHITYVPTYLKSH